MPQHKSSEKDCSGDSLCEDASVQDLELEIFAVLPIQVNIVGDV